MTEGSKISHIYDAELFSESLSHEDLPNQTAKAAIDVC